MADTEQKNVEAGTGECLKCKKQTQPKMLCKCPERQVDGSWKEVVEAKPDPIVKVEHKNIYEALSAFQGENVVIERTKHVSVKSKKGEESSYDFWYAPLDEAFKQVRPMLAKHGLSFVHVSAGETSSGNEKMVCVLYHETYKKTFEKTMVYERKGGTTDDEMKNEPRSLEREVLTAVEENVIRSMPLTVKRTGDMKDVGAESTYARRITFAEVVGIAPDEDNDVRDMSDRVGKLESFAFKKARESVTGAKDGAALTEQATFFENEKKALADGKKPSLGLLDEQYDELISLVVKRRTELGKTSIGKGGAGDNKDGGGQGTIT